MTHMLLLFFNYKMILVCMSLPSKWAVSTVLKYWLINSK